MKSVSAAILFLGYLAVASARPNSDLKIFSGSNPSLVSNELGLFQSVPEDPEPIQTVTSCGGFINSTSATITFRLNENLAANQRCIWTIKVPFTTLRFNLTRSGLRAQDGLFVTKFQRLQGTPTDQIQLNVTNTNFTMSGAMFLVTLSAGPQGGFNPQGFSLDYFSSGSLDGERPVSGFAQLSSTFGSFSYPEDGFNYRPNEDALFVLNPELVRDRIVRFTRMDIEQDSTCRYDSVQLYTWKDNSYSFIEKVCGQSILPPPFNFPGGIGLITFVTDSSVERAGFSFTWE